MIHVTLRWRHSSIGRRFDFYQREATGEVWINFGSGGHFQWPFKFWIYILYGKVGPRIARTSLVCLELGANSSGSWALARGARADIRQRCAHSLGWRAFASEWCAHTLWSKDARTTWNARLRQWCDASVRLLGDKSCAVGAPEARIGPQGDRIGDRIGIVGAH